MNKRGTVLLEQIIFWVLNIVFFVLLMAFVWRASTGVVVIEEIYAKQIALAVDMMKPGTEANISLSELYDIAKKNKFEGYVVLPEPDKNLITVRAADSEGYSHHYFSNLKNLQFNLDKENKNLIIKAPND